MCSEGQVTQLPPCLQGGVSEAAALAHKAKQLGADSSEVALTMVSAESVKVVLTTLGSTVPGLVDVCCTPALFCRPPDSVGTG